VRLDVTDDAQIAAAARKCGDVTLLVNNAGINQKKACSPRRTWRMRA